MILIGEILVSSDILKEEFVCHLERCKGACCVGGDYGAPIDDNEIEILTQALDEIKPFMDTSGVSAIEEHGVFQTFEDPAYKGVTLREDLACAFVRIDESGIAHCTIEKAWKAGATEFRKPISCHLYPVRVTATPATGFHALNYDRWSLCRTACTHGRKLGVPLYQFVREALVRRYGQGFYDELERVAKDMAEQAGP